MKRIKLENDTTYDQIQLKLLGRRCDRLATTCHKNYIVKIEDQLKDNPKCLWSFVRARRSGSSAYPVPMSDGLTSSSNGSEICELFANYFSILSVFVNVLQTIMSDGYLTGPLETLFEQTPTWVC